MSQSQNVIVPSQPRRTYPGVAKVQKALIAAGPPKQPATMGGTIRPASVVEAFRKASASAAAVEVGAKYGGTPEWPMSARNGKAFGGGSDAAQNQRDRMLDALMGQSNRIQELEAENGRLEEALSKAEAAYEAEAKEAEEAVAEVERKWRGRWEETAQLLNRSGNLADELLEEVKSLKEQLAKVEEQRDKAIGCAQNATVEMSKANLELAKVLALFAELRDELDAVAREPPAEDCEPPEPDGDSESD